MTIDTSNETEFMQRIRHGRDFASMLPEERLAYQEASLTKPVVATPVEANPLSAAQLAYLGDRRPEDLTDALDIENYRSLQSKAEPEIEVKAPVLDSPVDWRNARLDHVRMQRELGPTERLAIAHSFDAVKRGGPQNAREIDRLQAESWLARN